MKVWVDLANSPHPLLFEPVARRLAELGAEVAVTVRDHAQTAELALERWPEADVIGGASEPGRRAKAAAMLRRVRALRSWARGWRPDVALSHNSYGQLLAARSLGVPAVTAMDFEHQPANHVAFRCARRILVPGALPAAGLRRQGARSRKVVRYEGLKEELYLSEFAFDSTVLDKMGVQLAQGQTLAVMRTAPAGAIYHREENPLLVEILRNLAARSDVRCVVLARHPRQRAELANLGLPRVVVPSRAVDSRSLMCVADLFLGAGGTMTREAALIGVPTLSIFGGRPPAVDLWLEQRGLLRRIEQASEVGDVRPAGDARMRGVAALRERGPHLVDLFARTTLAASA